MDTVIHFEYGGRYSTKRDESQWIAREQRNYAIMMKEITYAELVDKIGIKIRIDKCSKLVISYFSMVIFPRKPTYIYDDGDLLCYLADVNKDNCRSVLHVEVTKDVEQIQECEQIQGCEQIHGCEQIQMCEQVGEEDRGSAVVVSNSLNTSAFVVSNSLDTSAFVVSNSLDTSAFGVSNSLDTSAVVVSNSLNTRVIDGSMNLYSTEPAAEDELVEYVSIDDIDGSANVVDNSGEYLRHEWDDEIDLVLGQVFSSKREIQDLVEKAAHQNCFNYDIINSDKKLWVVKCSDRKNGCKWHLRVAKIINSDFFSVRTYTKMHTCCRATTSTSINMRRGTPRLVASVLHDDYPGVFETPAPKSLISMVQGRLGVKVSYCTALRGKKQAASDVRGSPIESFSLVYSYMYMLEKMNPGTKTYVEVDEEQKFKYLFFSLKACYEGFQAMRKVIIVDGTHIKTIHKGVLMVASAQDPNRHHYPIAFGVVDGENDASLGWFFNKLKSVVPDVPGLVFVSDRNQSIINSIQEVYPLSKHGFCIWHLAQNVKANVSHVNKKTVATKFMECAKAYTEIEFLQLYGEFKRRYPAAGVYVDKIPLEKWARCYFPGDRYNIVTTNTVESINAVFRKARNYSLLPMIDAIVDKMIEWFNRYRNVVKEISPSQIFVTRVEKKMHKRCKDAKMLTVIELNSLLLEYKVIGRDDNNYLVDLRRLSCSCKRFDIARIPCVHAIAAACSGSSEIHELHHLCSKYYWIEQWALAYCMTIYPVPHKSHWIIPDDIRVLYALPSEYEKKKGRIQVARFPSTGEHGQRRRRRKRGQLYSYLDGDSSE